MPSEPTPKPPPQAVDALLDLQHPRTSMRSRREWPHASRVAILIAVLPLIPITFFDLRVSQLVADRANVVGKFVSAFGELPGHTLILFALLFLTVVSSSVMERITCSIVLLFLMWIVFIDLVAFVNAIVSGFLLLLVAVLFTFTVSKLKTNETVRQVSKIIAFLAVIAPLFIVQTMKWLWGRTRFQDLSPDYSDFTAWFLAQGPTGHHSFPSGHTAMGWMLLPLLLLANSRKQLFIISAFVIVWGVFVATGRVVSGAHYLSDVYFSTLICISTFVILRHRVKMPA